MAHYRMVNTRFWDDSYILTLDTHEKLLFLYFLTNPLTEICGAYEISLQRISFDTGIVDSLLKAIIGKFSSDKRIIYQNGWVFIPNFVKNQSLNPKVLKGVQRSLLLAPKWIQDIAYDSLSHLIQPNLTKPKGGYVAKASGNREQDFRANPKTPTAEETKALIERLKK